MSEQLMAWLTGGFFTAWFFALGGSFGSFLNVVVWRMPRNKPLALGGSYCPKCNTPILFQDNIPILGWIKLRGKCRACALPISPRYPIVESIAAVTFATFFLLEVVSHGANLPNWFPKHNGDWLSELPGCELLTIYIRHITLLYFLFGMALIDWDRETVPARLTIFTLVLSFVYTLLMPESMPLSLVPGLSGLEQTTTYQTAALHWCLNASMSLCVALIIPAACHFASLSQRLLMAQMLFLIGCYLGWQVGLLMTFAAILALIVQKIQSRFPTGITLLCAVTLFLLTWSLLDKADIPFESLTLKQSYVAIGTAIVLGFLTSMTTKLISKPAAA